MPARPPPKMIVEIVFADNRTEHIEVRDGDDPSQLARQFLATYKLPASYEKVLREQIVASIAEDERQRQLQKPVDDDDEVVVGVSTISNATTETRWFDRNSSRMLLSVSAAVTVIATAAALSAFLSPVLLVPSCRFFRRQSAAAATTPAATTKHATTAPATAPASFL